MEGLNRKLVLENGSVYYGTGFGAEAEIELLDNGVVVGRGNEMTIPQPKLWSAENETGPSCKTLGKGRVYRRTAMEDVLAAEKILPDFESEAPAHFVRHRLVQQQLFGP